MENWRRFIEEQELKEATDEEISYLDEVLQMPVENLPFTNIFGDRYRIIEELRIIDPNSPLKMTMDALMNMGWEVGNPTIVRDEKGRVAKGSKMPCTKTKVINIVKNGEQITLRKSITLNLPKLLSGIIKFIENFKQYQKEHFDLMEKTFLEVTSRGKIQGKTGYESVKHLPDEKYLLPGNPYGFRVNEKTYNKLIRFFNDANYWLGLSLSDSAWSHGDPALQLQKDKRFNFDKMKEFSLFLDQKFQNFLDNIGDLYENYYLVYSRHPIDVFRMSDHQGLESCHSLPSGGSGRWDEHNICALAEAYGNGMIVYSVPESEFEQKGVEPTNEGLEEFDDAEIFADEMRGNDGLVPSSRLRIRNTSYHGGDEPIRLAVAEKRVYGVELPGFRKKINNRMAESQKQEINKIAESGQLIDLSEFTRYGGEWQDNYVEDLIPQLFSLSKKGNMFTGKVNYDWDLQNSLSQKVGRPTITLLRSQLDDIFESYTGGMISFSYNVFEDHDGHLSYDWNMFIRFQIDFKADDMPYEVYKKVKGIVDDVAKYQFPDWFGFEDEVETDVVWSNIEQKLLIILDYQGSNLVGHVDIDSLDEEINTLLYKNPKYSQLFDRYATDGPVDLIKNDLKLHGLIDSEEYKIENIIEKHNLEDKSWWDLEERETESRSFGEITIGASFQRDYDIYPDEIIEEVPDNLRPAAIRIMTEYINMLTNNWKFSTEIVHGQQYNDNLAPITITAAGYLAGDSKISIEDMTELVEQGSGLSLMFATGMTKSMSMQKLEGIANFLVNDADPDDIFEKIEQNIKAKIASAAKGQVSENRKRIRIKIIR